MFNEEKNKQINTNSDFKNLRSDYFLQKLFNNMKQKRTLEIIKCNKQLQKRLKINIDNYKKFCQIYSSIEIELKLADNKYGKFIDIPHEDMECFYHIYFDNSKIETRSNYLGTN